MDALALAGEDGAQLLRRLLLRAPAVRATARRVARRRLLPVVAVVALGVGLALAPGAAVYPESRPFAGTSTVGALFGYDGATLAGHFCSASVIDSPAGDLVLTAAHCIAGLRPRTFAFVPGFDDGKAPFGVWVVTTIMTDAQWRRSNDPDDDFAFLVVQRENSPTPIESLTGGEPLGLSELPSQMLTVIAYPDSSNEPITCNNAGSSFGTSQIEFDCAGFSDGTSGGPILLGGKTARRVIGVIGGYQQGGYTDSVSYAAKFSGDLAALYRTAISG